MPGFDGERLPALGDRLASISADVRPEDLFPSLVPAASRLARSDPYAFVLATCLDRGTRADIIWTIPYDLKSIMGHLDPGRIAQLSIVELAGVFRQLPRKPRYMNAAPRTVRDITRIVVDDFRGDASAIWRGRSADEVMVTFRRVYGVGPGIASMAVIIIEKAFGPQFSSEDHRFMDIKPDVQTKRVLYRLGVAPRVEEQAAIHAARVIRPEFPGEIDSALWRIGRNWCFAVAPLCSTCPISDVCLKVGVT